MPNRTPSTMKLLKARRQSRLARKPMADFWAILQTIPADVLEVLPGYALASLLDMLDLQYEKRNTMTASRS